MHISNFRQTDCSNQQIPNFQVGLRRLRHFLILTASIVLTLGSGWLHAQPRSITRPPDISVAAGFWIEFETIVGLNNGRPVTKWELLLGDPENTDPSLRSGRILEEDTKIYTSSDSSVSARLLFGPITASDAGEFRLRVTEQFGSRVSGPATLTVITTAPERARYVGDRTTITAPLSRLGVFQYQWHKDYNRNHNSTPEQSIIPGATATNYVINNAQPDDAGLYSVVVTDPFKRNSLVHVLSLSVSQPPVAPTPLTITTQPAAVTVMAGEGASFSVATTGSRPVSYQWRKDGNAIANATDSTYTIASTVLADAGAYSVVVTNEVGSVTSAAATLTVNYQPPVAPEIFVQPEPVTRVLKGEAATFRVAAIGTAPLAYQWRKDGNAIANATNSTYTIASTARADVGTYSVVVTNEVGSVTSAGAFLAVEEVPAAPEITTQPAAVTVVEGEAATFNVVATGTAPLTYQWRKDGNAIVSATVATYTIASTAVADAGAYSVVVTDEAGSSVTSAAATLTVYDPSLDAPEIFVQPDRATRVLEGEAATFRVVATGTAPFTYQWRKDGTAITNATAATYTIASTMRADTGAYSVVVTNGAGSITSAGVFLSVEQVPAAPEITAQPAAVAVVEGEAASFSVTATDSGSLTYQWRKDGNAIANATAATYTIASTELADAGAYSVVVTNEAGSSVTSAAATLTVYDPSLVAPEIFVQPEPVTMVEEGEAASFRVMASGTAPLTYQWRKDGNAIANATAATYTIASTVPTDSGTYSVVVTNGGGSVTSAGAFLAVEETPVAPEITTQPAAVTVVEGETASFSVTATGSRSLTYQWRKDGNAIANATNSTYTIASTVLADAGAYSVVVTNEVGDVTSADATLTVNEVVVDPAPETTAGWIGIISTLLMSDE